MREDPKQLLADLDDEQRARLKLLVAYARDRLRGGRSIVLRKDEVPPKHYDPTAPPRMLEVDWEDEAERYRLATWRWIPEPARKPGWNPWRITHPTPARVKEAITKFLLRGHCVPLDPPISDGARERRLTGDLERCTKRDPQES